MTAQADTSTRLGAGQLDDDGFRRIYEDHSGAVYAVVCRLCSPGFADDVTQEVFLRFWQRPERFDPARGSLRTYLLAIAHNHAVDVVRSNEARRAREDNDEWMRPAFQTDIDHRLLAADQRATVARALELLHGDLREAIVTAYFGGCTYKAAAVVLGVPEGTLKSRIRCGLHRVRETLDTSATADHLAPNHA